MKQALWEVLTPGPKGKIPDIVHVIVEVPKDSNTKYEMDDKTGAFFLSRDLFTSMVYPGDYGLIPQTLADDEDAVDALVLVSRPHAVGSVIMAKPIGVLRMSDEHGKDEKIICVPIPRIDPKFKDYNDVKDLPDHVLTEIKHFFNRYKELEPGKWVKIERMEGSEVAKRIILKGIERFDEKHKKD